METVINEIKSLYKLISRNIAVPGQYDDNLNHTQIQILMYLFDNTDVCQKDLENATHLKKASITGSLDSLEKKGIIKRIKSKNDKRKNIIVLTDKTLKGKDSIDKKLEAVEQKTIKNISKEEITTLLSIINKMENNLK